MSVTIYGHRKVIIPPLYGHCTAIVRRLVLSLGSAPLRVLRQSMGWVECRLFDKADEILRQHRRPKTILRTDCVASTPRPGECTTLGVGTLCFMAVSRPRLYCRSSDITTTSALSVPFFGLDIRTGLFAERRDPNSSKWAGFPFLSLT